MLYNRIKLVVTLLFFGCIAQMNAQEKIPFDQGTKYILADVFNKLSAEVKTFKEENHFGRFQLYN